ncbi:MAG: extracellular solute-binding protein [Clostridiales bacterium]|nr:extracellular solute-binding protein [Clostridiales bacterium]
MKRTIRECKGTNKLWAKRGLAVLLCVAMVLPIASCKKSGQEGQGSDGSSQTQQSAPLIPVAQRETQYVQETDPYFTDSEVEFPVPVDEGRQMEGVSVRNCRIVNDRVCFIYNAEYMQTQEERDEINSLSGKWDEESQLRYFELLDSLNESGLLSYSMDGESVVKFAVPGGKTVQGFFALKDGRIGAILNGKSYEYNEQAQQCDMIWEESLVYFSAEGELLEEFPIEADLQSLFGGQFFELDNGNIIIVGETDVLIVDHQGNILGRDSFYEYRGSAFEEGGKYYILFSKSTIVDDTVKYEKTVREIDTATGKLGDPQPIDPSIPDIFFDCGEACYAAGQLEPVKKIDVLGGKVEVLMDYAYTDITPFSDDVADFRCDQDTDLYFLTRKTFSGNTSWVQSVPVLVHLHKEEKNPHAGRPILYAATCKTDWDSPFTQAVNAYNKRPESKARIVVYSPETDVPGYGAAQADMADQILLSMKSGSGPDILLNCGEFSQFNSDKILVDLNPYMDGATGINRADYYDNIFRAFEVGGKLYQLPIKVQVDGFLGNPDLLGGVDSWTISDFDAKMGSIGNGVYPLLGWSRSLDKYWDGEETGVDVIEPLGMLDVLLAHDLYHYVDYSNGNCSFDSDDFRTLLQIAGKYGGRIDREKLIDLGMKYDDMSDTDQFARAMQDGVGALAILEFASLRFFSPSAYLCGGAPLYLGWPTSGQSGLGAMADVSVGISAYSRVPEEAWDFVSFLLTDDSLFIDEDAGYYRSGGILVQRSALDVTAQQELDAYLARVELYKDEPGMIELDAKLSEESLRKYKEVIGTIHSCVQVDMAIFAIVMEEAPAYFNGQKSADDVSKTIQNRVSTMLAEQG